MIEDGLWRIPTTSQLLRERGHDVVLLNGPGCHYFESTDDGERRNPDAETALKEVLAGCDLIIRVKSAREPTDGCQTQYINEQIDWILRDDDLEPVINFDSDTLFDEIRAVVRSRRRAKWAQAAQSQQLRWLPGRLETECVPA